MAEVNADIARIVILLQELVKITNATQQSILASLPPGPTAPPLGRR